MQYIQKILEKTVPSRSNRGFFILWQHTDGTASFVVKIRNTFCFDITQND